MAVNKKEIREEAKKLLNQGISKQEVFDTLLEEYSFAIEIAKILKYLPSKKALNKYKIWNYILLGLLIASVLFYVFTSSAFSIFIWYGALIYIVSRMLVKYYYWVTLFSGFSIVTHIGLLILDPNSRQNLEYLLPILTVSIFILVLSFLIVKKMCPKPTEKKVEYTNSDGNQRMKIVYEFVDEL